MRTPMQVGRRDETIVSGRKGISLRSGVWTRRTGSVIELARLSGPRTGSVRPPAYLFPDEPEPPRIDLADCAAKARLYTACLIHGSPYDAYRYINVFDLAILLPTLKLPHALAASWTRAFRDAGVVCPTDLRQERHRRYGSLLMGRIVTLRNAFPVVGDPVAAIGDHAAGEE